MLDIRVRWIRRAKGRSLLQRGDTWFTLAIHLAELTVRGEVEWFGDLCHLETKFGVKPLLLNS